MKKTFIIAVLTVLVFACSRKTIPTTETGSATTTDSVKQDVAVMDEAHATLAEQGKTVYTTRCNRCHALKDVTAYTATRWDGILKNMIPKAKLDSIQAQQVTAYVMDNAKK